MEQQQYSNIENAIQQIVSGWKICRLLIQSSTSKNTIIPNFGVYTLNDLDQLIEYISTIDRIPIFKEDNDFEFIFKPQVPNFISWYQALVTQLNQLTQTVNQYQNKRSFELLANQTLVLVDSNNATLIDVNPFLINIFSNAQAIFSTSAQINSWIPRDVKPVVENQQKLKKLLTETEKKINEISVFRGQASANSSVIESSLNNLRIKEAEITDLQDKIHFINSSYESTVKNSDEVNSIAKSISDVDSDLKQKKEEINKILPEIETMKNEAEKLLAGATGAGLASELKKAKEIYRTRMYIYQIAIVVVIIIAVFISSSNFLVLDTHLTRNLGDQSNWILVIARYGLIAPLVWLVIIFSKKQNENFNLEREYAHKFALAMSVKGFTVLAEEYAEEMTAEVFLEILTNPSQKKPDYENERPLIDRLRRMRKVKKKINSIFNDGVNSSVDAVTKPVEKIMQDSSIGHT